VVEYYKAGVPFYAIVDYYPELEQRQVHVLGYRATPDGYVRVDLNDQERLWLDSVRLWLASAGELAVCFDDLGVRVPNVQELNRGARLARQQAADALSGKQQAEQATLLAQQQAADALSGKQQAEQAALLAQQQAADALSGKQQAEQAALLARQQADNLAARLAELEAAMRQLGGESRG